MDCRVCGMQADIARVAVNNVCNQAGFLNYVSDIISSYIDDADIFSFHSVGKDQPEHMICYKCYSNLQDDGLRFDTNLVNCPIRGCPRSIFISLD